MHMVKSERNLHAVFHKPQTKHNHYDTLVPRGNSNNNKRLLQAVMQAGRRQDVRKLQQCYQRLKDVQRQLAFQQVISPNYLQ